MSAYKLVEKMRDLRHEASVAAARAKEAEDAAANAVPGWKLLTFDDDGVPLTARRKDGNPCVLRVGDAEHLIRNMISAGLMTVEELMAGGSEA